MSEAKVGRLRAAHEAFLAGKGEFGGELLDPEETSPTKGRNGGSKSPTGV